MAPREKVYRDNKTHLIRANWTVDFVKKHLPSGSKILDLGPKNALSKRLESEGYLVQNAYSNDLDAEFDCASQAGFDAFTSFEVFEHMVSPMPLLKSIQAPLLITSIPLSLWFAKAYRGDLNDDPFDEHYHEFEPWQFELLLRKSGWNIEEVEYHRSYKPWSFGLRPLLRRVYPRYMLVFASRT